jgi:CRISPR/Cas system-associated exonuclease Cas4 (RecB family)
MTDRQLSSLLYFRGKIMVNIPSTIGDQIVTRIYEGYEKADKSPHIYLGRLGSSSIGDECLRRIWFDWRAFEREEFEGRMLRLFGTGHWQEERVVEDLRRAGYSVWDLDENGKQHQAVDKSGHFITKLDGVIKGVPNHKEPHILEIKTHNKLSYNATVKHGIVKNKPQHYAQMQITMYLKKIKAGIYLSVCKDDERIHIERIEADTKVQQTLVKRIKSLIDATLIPAGISDDAGSFGCKFCSFKKVCVKEEPPLKNCRTCTMCKPIKEGRWMCDLNKQVLTFKQQRKACSEYEAI